MKPAELERLLALADEVESLERRMHRAETLVAEVARDEDVVSAAPRIGEAMTRAGSALEPIARELEREWVDQGRSSRHGSAVELSRSPRRPGPTRARVPRTSRPPARE